MKSVPPTELMGSLAMTSAQAEGLISVGYRADGPPITLGKAKSKGDRVVMKVVKLRVQVIFKG